ncbi:MAG: PAS domain-containing protein [Thermoanaerobaculia bacterium]
MRRYIDRLLYLPAKIDRKLEHALDLQVLRALSPVSTGLAVAFSLFGVLHGLDDLEFGAKVTIVAADVIVVACLALLTRALWRGLIAAHHANLIGLAVVGLCLADVLIVFSLARDPFYLSYLAIVVITCGCVLLSVRWLLAALALTLVSSTPVALVYLGSGSFYHFVLTLAAASALATIILIARRGYVLRTQMALAAARAEASRRHTVEASLHESERRMELAIAGSQGGWWDIEMDPLRPDDIPDAISLDPSIKAFIGFQDSEFPNSLQAWRDRILEEDLPEYSAAARNHLKGLTPLYQIEYRVRHQDGSVRWIFTRGRISRDKRGKPVRWSGIDWDITDSKQTGDRLNLLQRAVEQSSSLVIITDTEARIEYVNPKFTRVTGYSPDEIIGSKPSVLKSDQTPREVHRELWRALSAGHEWQGEFRNRKKDGSAYWVISSISPIKDADGVTRHYLSVQEDITERKRIEARLAQSQRLESVGQLVSGVAHDFNNLLTAVIGFAELGIRQLSAGEPLRRELLEIKKAGQSADDLTRQLLAFSSRQMLELQALDLNRIVTDIEELLRRTISEDIELDFELSSELGATRADPAQMRQILVNLAVNARDAMPGGGRLTIRTDDVELDDQFDFGTETPVAGPYVLLAVTDTGHGIDERNQARVFEPFYTSKPRGQGTGLGLSTVYGVVKQCEGYISLDSEPGVGTCFKIYLPRVRETIEPQTAALVAPSDGGDETILVVEDNAGVRKVAAQTLKTRGYRVFSCSSPENAIQVFAEHEIDLLLTDMVMPGTNGAGLARELLSRKPSLRVLLMSGYTERSLMDLQGLGPGTPFLHKPFRLDDLLTKVRESLEGGH